MRTVGKAVANKEPRLAHFRPAKELLNKARLANAGFPRDANADSGRATGIVMAVEAFEFGHPPRHP